MSQKTPLPPARVAALHDLSCFGRCALTVVIPTLSAMGHQVVPIPTALLSTHTGGFTDLHFCDLTDHIDPIASHLESLPTAFRSIYTGFLGSERQIDLVFRLLDRFAEKPDESGALPLILVDPVMGDDGELYSTYTKALCLGTQRLVRRAHIMTPNWTEACILTDTPYQNTLEMKPKEALSAAQVLLKRLSELECRYTVITGIALSDGTVANLGQTDGAEPFCIRRPMQKQSYPGTGDLFASVLLGEMLRHRSFEHACRHAADFTATVVARSASIATPVRDGVALERELWRLCRQNRIGGIRPLDSHLFPNRLKRRKL